jgi:hypothetical protein
MESEKNTLSSDELQFKKVSYNFLLTFGSAMADKEKYPKARLVHSFSGKLLANYNKTKEALDEITLHGIDYEKSSQLEDDVTYEFDSTFDPPRRVNVVLGLLVTNSGKEYFWGCVIESSLGELISFLSSKEANDTNAAIEKLKIRLKKS